jgi:Pectate lyase superfamily protein
MKRVPWSVLLSSLAIVVASLALWHSRRTAVDAHTVHRMAANFPASPSWYANEHGASEFWVTDPSYVGGADPTGVADSTAAIQATLTAAAVAGGEVLVPPGTYTITAPLKMSGPGVSMRGIGAVGVGGAGGATIAVRSGSTMRHMLLVAETTDLENLVFNGGPNREARYGVAYGGTKGSVFRNLEVLNTNYAGIYNQNNMGDVVYSAVTTLAGTSPPPVISGDFWFGGSIPFTVQIIAGGPLGTATYQGNTGAGFGLTYTMPIDGKIEVLFAGDLGDLGPVATFQAHNYVAGDKWTWTASATQSNDENALVEACRLHDNGQIYSTTGLAGEFASWPVTHEVGTVTTDGSRYIVGSGTNWLNIYPEYDYLILKNGGTIFVTQIEVVQDNFHIYCQSSHIPPAGTWTDWAIATGFGYDEQNSGPTGLATLLNVDAYNNGNSGAMPDGANGGQIIGGRYFNNGVAGITVGLDIQLNIPEQQVVSRPLIDGNNFYGLAMQQSRGFQLFSVLPTNTGHSGPGIFYGSFAGGGNSIGSSFLGDTSQQNNGAQFGTNQGPPTATLDVAGTIGWRIIQAFPATTNNDFDCQQRTSLELYPGISGDITFTGFRISTVYPNASGQWLELWNGSNTGRLVLKHLSASSLAANRIFTQGDGSDYMVEPDGYVRLRYSPQGFWTLANGATAQGGPSIQRANFANSPYTIKAQRDMVVLVDVSGGPVSVVTAQYAQDGDRLTVVNSGGDASVNNITVTSAVVVVTGTLVDPNNPSGTPTTSVLLKIKHGSATWTWGATEQTWQLN